MVENDETRRSDPKYVERLETLNIAPGAPEAGGIIRY